MKRLFKIGSDRHGVGSVLFAWHPDGNYLATAGKNCLINITNRLGEIIEEISMSPTSPILSMCWDKDGDILAILQDSNSNVSLWSLSTRKIVLLDTELKDPTFMLWSKLGPQLAVGNAKGSLLMYNKNNKRKMPFIGKHSKKILCGAWSPSVNRLALGSADKNITVSSEEGETLFNGELMQNPDELLFTVRKTEKGEDLIVSSVQNGQSLLLYNLSDTKDGDPMEFTFATNENGKGCAYGSIIHHHWIEDSLVLVGFNEGYMMLVSGSARDLGVQKICKQIHPSSLINFDYNSHTRMCASGGDDGIRVYDSKTFEETDYIPRKELEDGKISNLAWSPDGQILTISTVSGNTYNFLAKMNILYSRYRKNVAYLSSLRDVCIENVVKKTRIADITLKLEPSIIALGSKFLAAGMNNQVYFHPISKKMNQDNVLQREYVHVVRDIVLNESYCAILSNSKVLIHAIDPSSNSDIVDMGTKTFPSRDEGPKARVSCIALTEHFLFYGTEGGTIEIFYIPDRTILPVSGIDNKVKKIYPNESGTRAVIIDSENQVFLYNPVVASGGINHAMIKFDINVNTIVNVLWDNQVKNVIIIFDGKFIHTYLYTSTSAKGSYLTKLGPMSVTMQGEINLQPDIVEIKEANIPILASNGILTCQTPHGNLSTVLHPYFNTLVDIDGTDLLANEETVERKVLSNRFCQLLALGNLEDAWSIALHINRRQHFLALSGKAMESLDIELAMRVYRQLGDAGKVMALQDMLHIEDKLLLAGHIALQFENFALAQELFLSSSQPSAALYMRRDLLHWDQALQLAEALNLKQEIPEISIKYAQQLEFRNEIETAKRMFESGLVGLENIKVPSEDLKKAGKAGVAKCELRLGQITKGISLALDIQDKSFWSECGDILVQQKQYSDATKLLIKAEEYAKVATIYNKFLLKDKSRITEAALIMKKVQNDSLNSAFGKICVAAGRYEEAAQSYERAKDLDKVVELKLRHLDQVQDAYDLVRQTSSAQGAMVIAQYCQEKNDIRSAIEFLLIANKSDEAFVLAQDNGLVQVFATLQGDSITTEDAMKVAEFYEKSQDYTQAGKFYSLCGQYPKALKFFIKSNEIDEAIAVVGKSQSQFLINQLLDYLVGETDGIPKDQNYLYRLHIALKRYDTASQTALLIVKQEQEIGNYQLAHKVLIETIGYLEDANMKVMSELRELFILLHSYVLAKVLANSKHNQHENAARLLIRVCQHISKFPNHGAKILVSTVIECQRGEMKVSAYEHAVLLMKPEFRQGLNELNNKDIKRKIESIVRRRSPAIEEEKIDSMSPCPLTNELIHTMVLESPNRDAIPMCIITGQHMIIDDWCFCPNSKFPALYSEYKKYIKREIESQSSNEIVLVLDPLLGKPINEQDLELVSIDIIKKYIQRYNNIFDDAMSTNTKTSNTTSDALDQVTNTNTSTNSIEPTTKVRKVKSKR